jgi:hypothetical protein
MKKRTFFSFLLVLVITLVAQAQVPVEIRTNNVKARGTPDTKAPAIATLHKGEVFVITDDQPYWYEITLHNGKSAWVRKSSCTVVDKVDSQDNQDESNPSNPSPSITNPPVSSPSCTETSVPADWSVCPATGSGGMYAQAYVQKNRTNVPCTYTPMSVDDMLALRPLSKSVRALPDTDPDAQYLKSAESKTVVVEGFLALAKDGGKEGVNCGSGARLDTHMELVDTDSQDPKGNRTKHVIAEITPWFHEAVPTWSTTDVGQFASYVSDYKAPSEKNPPTKIRVYGYLFFDEAHATGAESWRGTAWEVHPTTKIEIFENGVWKEIGGVH